jgi:hypothetical protein
MLDRRTVIRREWGYFWRFMVVTIAVWLLAVIIAGYIAGAASNGGTALVGSPAALLAVVMLNAVLTIGVQLVLVGVSSAVLVRVYIRSYHPIVIALVSNGAAMVTALAGGVLIVPQIVAASIALGWTFYLRRSLIDLYRENSAWLCRTCFYDLRGLPGPVCPECGASRQVSSGQV